MSIEIDRVSAVLLADGWHSVKDKSFHVGDYLYVARHNDNDAIVVAHSGHGLELKSFAFTDESGAEVYGGPLSSILAVRMIPYNPVAETG